MKRIPFIEASGSNYEIGFAIGQKLKKQIRELIKIEQKGKPDSISLSFIGHLPGLSIGFNSEGCAYTENSIYAKGINRKDLPMQFLVRAHLDVKKMAI